MDREHIQALYEEILIPSALRARIVCELPALPDYPDFGEVSLGARNIDSLIARQEAPTWVDGLAPAPVTVEPETA